MKLVRKPGLWLLSLVASISVLLGVDKDKGKFTPPALESITARQNNAGVTVAAVPYHTGELAGTAFGKVNPYEHGALPILLVIQNASQHAIRLERIRVQYIDADRTRIEPTPSSEVPFLKAPERPNYNPLPIPIRRGKKNPLAAQEIELRAFAAKMLPPGESAHGFFYFQTGHRRGARLYITGIDEAKTNSELFYFDLPLD